jgi:UDP-2-acetamido-3-amino-2,3-dideoxy-glucuronate N-acetyltransferase
MSYFVHPSSIVDEGAHIGDGTRIWHFCHVMSYATIGKSCNFGHNVFIGPYVSIGDNVKVQNNVSIYDGVTLEDDVFCGPSVVFTNVRNPRAATPRNTRDDFEKTLVKRGATLGANTTIRCGVTIGEYAFIGAGAVLTKDALPYSLWVGNPAKQIGWACKCGERLSLKDGAAICDCGERYALQGERLERTG